MTVNQLGMAVFVLAGMVVGHFLATLRYERLTDQRFEATKKSIAMILVEWEKQNDKNGVLLEAVKNQLMTIMAKMPRKPGSSYPKFEGMGGVDEDDS